MEHFENPLDFHFDGQNATEVEARGVYVEALTPANQIEKFTGSSFACPHITAIAARLKENFPDMSAFEFKTALSSLSTRNEVPL